MAKLERYISVGQKRLRCGYTTGTCAAAAARGAAELLLRGAIPASVVVDTPAGVAVTVEFEEVASGPGWASCAVRKDGGDDPDVTDGMLIFARVERFDEPGIVIDGGEGVGRVTREGLDQPVGNAAINSTPRRMISEQVQAVLDESGDGGMTHSEFLSSLKDGSQECAQKVASGASEALGLKVTISVPGGKEVARKTFNPRLGIEGGISIIGTSGIVKPMSEEALIASIQLEMRQRKAEGQRDLLVTPGNYGADFARDVLHLDLERAVQCSNYLGACIDYAVELGFTSFLLVAHIGKAAKMAAGIMNTHSRVADGRRETMAAHAAMAGASREAVVRIMDATTTDDVISIMDEEGVREQAMKTLVDAVGFQLHHRAGDLRIEAIVFSKVYGLLGMTAGATELLAKHVNESGDGEVAHRNESSDGGMTHYGGSSE